MPRLTFHFIAARGAVEWYLFEHCCARTLIRPFYILSPWLNSLRSFRKNWEAFEIIEDVVEGSKYLSFYLH